MTLRFYEGADLAIYEIQNCCLNARDAFRNKNTQTNLCFPGSNQVEGL